MTLKHLEDAFEQVVVLKSEGIVAWNRECPRKSQERATRSANTTLLCKKEVRVGKLRTKRYRLEKSSNWC